MTEEEHIAELTAKRVTLVVGLSKSCQDLLALRAKVAVKLTTATDMDIKIYRDEPPLAKEETACLGAACQTGWPPMKVISFIGFSFSGLFSCPMSHRGVNGVMLFLLGLLTTSKYSMPRLQHTTTAECTFAFVAHYGCI